MRVYFPKLLGNDDTKGRIGGAIEGSTLAHAFLISGPTGSGKSTLATEIAAALNCENAENQNYPLPCGKCNACRRIYEGNFPDLKFLRKKRDKATLGVDEVKDFREDMFLSATEAEYKFYIIEDADLMTPAAQNALLKVLEEPPNLVHIILLATEADKILSTIKSRTQYVQTEIFDYETLRSHVLSLSERAATLDKSDKEKLGAILMSSSGIIGHALDMLDERQTDAIEARRECVKSFISALAKRAPFSSLYTATQALPQKREELRVTLEDIRSALRDLIVNHYSESTAPIFFLSGEDISDSLGSIGHRRLVEIYGIISSALEDIDKNVVIPTLLTDLAVRIKGKVKNEKQ